MAIWHVVCGVGWYPAHQVLCCMCMLDKSKTWSKQGPTWITYEVQLFQLQIFLMAVELRAQGTILNSLVGGISVYLHVTHQP